VALGADPYPVPTEAVVLCPRPEVVNIAQASVEAGQYRLDEKDYHRAACSARIRRQGYEDDQLEAWRALMLRKGYEDGQHDLLRTAGAVLCAIGLLLLLSGILSGVQK
jgi:hypothetical protein